MKVLLNDIIREEIKEFLLTQEGIKHVELNEVDLFWEVKVEHDSKITPNIIIKYIELFQDNKFTSMMSFDKENSNNTNTIKYTVDDICCEYCYMGLIKELFENKNIVSVKSNYDLISPAYDVELEIKYDNNYDEKDLIKFIEESI